MPITTPLAPPRASPPMKSILDACRAINHSDLCRTPYTAAAHRCRGYLRCRPSGRFLRRPCGRFHCRPCGRLRRRRAPCTAPAAKPGPRAMYLLRQRLGPRAMYLGGFHRPHCAATAAKPGPRAMYLLRQRLGPRVMYLGGFLAPTAPLRQQNSALAPCSSAAFIAPTVPLRQQNSALAPCTSAAFIAPTVPLRQQNSALAPCTCYGSNTRPSRHSSPGPRTATILGARIMIDGIIGKYTRAPTLYRIALMARPQNFSKWLTRSLPQR